MELLQEDGSVRLHRSLLDPSRHQILEMDRNRFFILIAVTSMGLFFSFYGYATTIDQRLWIAVGIAWVALFVVMVLFLKRLGSRGGYFHDIYRRRIREQECYPRSAHAAAPVTTFPDQQRR